MSKTFPSPNSNLGNLGIGTASATIWNTTSMSITDIRSALRVSGDAEIDGDLRVRGRSIDETLAKIEERLGILVPNKQLEAEWEQLHQLRMQYVELERELLEKQRTFNILKRP